MAMVAAAPAAACLPPVPGQTESDRLRPAFDASTDIVYGVVTSGARGRDMARFRVIHVYKGNLVPGAIISGAPSYGFDPPSCLGLNSPIPPPRASRGQYGVIAYNRHSPFLHFIDSYTLEWMFREGWIASAQR